MSSCGSPLVGATSVPSCELSTTTLAAGLSPTTIAVFSKGPPLLSVLTVKITRNTAKLFTNRLPVPLNIAISEIPLYDPFNVRVVPAGWVTIAAETAEIVVGKGNKDLKSSKT